MNNSIQLNHISKRFGSIKALTDVSLDIHPGELFGFIGPDGAGKTTLFRILTTLMIADKGNATICGLDVVHDFKKIRCCVGYMPSHFSLYQDLTVEENLNFFATVFHSSIEENYELVHDMYRQIEPFKHRRTGKLSGGMKQKLALCCALIHRPDILFLDEPTTGVDPVSRNELWNMLERLKTQGITILVSTPYMDEASRCDRIALMREGRILTVDTPEDIRSSFHHPLFSITIDDANAMYQLLKELRAYPQTLQCFSYGNAHHLTLKTNGTASIERNINVEVKRQQLETYLKLKGFREVVINSIKPSIEDCFMLL